MVHVMTQIPDIPILVTNPACSLAWFSVQNDLLLVVSLCGTLGGDIQRQLSALIASGLDHNNRASALE